VVKDEKTGEVTELRCTYDPMTKGGDSPDGRKVKATLHWVSAEHSLRAEVHLYDRLFNRATPEDRKDASDFIAQVNPDSLEILSSCRVESTLAGAVPGSHYQFERLGYFCVDAKDSSEEALVFNRTVPLRDTWGKMQKAGKQENN
jgi:glutaminyl-tRNA synthetase